MSFTDGIPERIRALRHKNQVDMTRHQAICPNRYLGPSGLLGEQGAIYLVIAVCEEYRFPSVSTLCDVVR
jgi:hypothetical protein